MQKTLSSEVLKIINWGDMEVTGRNATDGAHAEWCTSGEQAQVKVQDLISDVPECPCKKKIMFHVQARSSDYYLLEGVEEGLQGVLEVLAEVPTTLGQRWALLGNAISDRGVLDETSNLPLPSDVLAELDRLKAEVDALILAQQEVLHTPEGDRALLEQALRMALPWEPWDVVDGGGIQAGGVHVPARDKELVCAGIRRWATALKVDKEPAEALRRALEKVQDGKAEDVARRSQQVETIVAALKGRVELQDGTNTIVVFNGAPRGGQGMVGALGQVCERWTIAKSNTTRRKHKSVVRLPSQVASMLMTVVATSMATNLRTDETDPGVLDTFLGLWAPGTDDLMSSPHEALRAARGVHHSVSV